MRNKIVASELVEERSKCDFDKDERNLIFAGNKEDLDNMKKSIQDMKDHPAIANP
jgi:Holliday junction resolvase RusA-like endonuclease